VKDPVLWTTYEVAGCRMGRRVAGTSLSGVRTDNTLQVRFSAKVGEEPEIELGLV
jgi:hypothetical protein